MADTPKVVTLKCPNCGAALKISASVTEFACAYCGAQQVVERDGGIISLRLISESASRIQVSTDKTASELALQRLGGELRELEGRKLNILTDQNAEREKTKTERNRTTAGTVVLYCLLWIMLIWVGGLSTPSFLVALFVTIIVSVLRRMSRNSLARKDEKLTHEKFAPQLEAISSQIASVQTQIARHRSIINPQAAIRTAASPAVASAAAPIRQPEAATRKPMNKKIWLIPLLVAAICVVFVLPVIPIVMGSALVLVGTAYIFQRTRPIPAYCMKMKPDHQRANKIKLTSCVLLGTLLLIGGIATAAHYAETRHIAKDRERRDIERQRVEAENTAAYRKEQNEITKLLDEAAQAADKGDLSLAQAKFDEAGRYEYASVNPSLRSTRRHIANARVHVLRAEAEKQLKAGHIEAAKAKIDAALALRDANNFNEIKKMDAAIRNASDVQAATTILAELPDEAFALIQNGGELPATLISGYAVLDQKTSELVRQHIADITAARERIKQEKLAIAEKARQEAEARKVQAQAAAREAAARARGEDPRFEKGTGDTLTVGYTSYSVWRAEWSEDLSSNQFINKRANAKWLFIRLTVRNNDNKARVIPPLKLVDDRGNEYDSSSETAMIDNSIGILTTLNPDVSKQGMVVFDVPPDRTYRLKVSGGYWSSQTGYIRIEPK